MTIMSQKDAGRPHHHARAWRASAAAAALLVTCACRSVDAALLDVDRRDVRVTDPTDFAIAIAPFEIDAAAVRQKGELRLREPQKVRDGWMAALREARVAASVAPIEDAHAATASQTADLVIVPHVREVAFRYVELTDGAYATMLFWFTTWLGGLFVADSRYESKFVLECDVLDPSGGDVLANVRLRSEPSSLSFFERNDFVSLGTLESLVLPPFWTHDDGEVTSATLRERALLHTAAALKRWLRKDFVAALPADSALDFAFEGPRATSAETLDFALRLRATQRIAEARLYLDGLALVASDRVRIDGPAPLAAQQRDDDHYAVSIAVRGLALKPGRHALRAWIQLERGEVVRRTVEIERR